MPTERFAFEASSADLTPCSEPIAVFGPASLSNLGPGYDALGLCITGLGDRVEARRVEEAGVHLLTSGDGAAEVPTDPAHNTASVAAAAVLQKAGVSGGLALRIRKGIPLGSGVGGSAASAAAGAWAANRLLGAPRPKSELVSAVLDGEQIASGSLHGDNALPALLGGLVLMKPGAPTRYRRLTLPGPLHIALLLPELPVLTREARNILPDRVSHRDAVRNAASLAFIIDAFRAGDLETVGECMMEDRLVEPVRARLVPCYNAVRQAALSAGALGCALTGSGPALFALAATAEDAELIRRAMLEASRQAGIAATGLVTQTDSDGVREAS